MMRYNLVFPASRKYNTDFCISRSSYKKTVTRPGDSLRHKITVQGCNIDLCGYPHEEEEILDPIDTIREYQERRTTLNAEIDKVLAELEALLPGGVSE